MEGRFQDVVEDRSLEITGYLSLSVEHLVAALEESAWFFSAVRKVCGRLCDESGRRPK